VVIEHHVSGRELAATVLGPPGEPEVLPVIEIKTEEPFYTFRAHYDPGAAEMEVASLEPAVQSAVEDAARKAYAAAGCRDFARVDIILDRDSVPQILEINTIPGLTETGPTRFAAEAAGMDFAGLVQRVVGRAAAEAGANA
jgi:D-alanine-D-alanine ligase-like ATP-grasp enzyme